jgi:hypothetical protein
MGRPGGPGVQGNRGTREMLDKLLTEGKITAGQASQYRAWEAARPPIDVGRERFDAWMASRPNLPGLPPVRPPTGETDKTWWHQMDRPVIPPKGRRDRPARPLRKNVMEMLDQLERDNKITEAQAEQVRRWDKVRPPQAAGQEAFESWRKRRPDVPGLREYWGEQP